MTSAGHRTLLIQPVAVVGLCGRCSKNVGRRGQNETCFWSSILVASATFGELERRFESVENRVCETVVVFDFGHDDDFLVQHFGCKRNTL